MSDTTDDLEAYGYDGEEDEDEFDALKRKIERLEKMIYGMNIKINSLEKKICVMELSK